MCIDSQSFRARAARNGWMSLVACRPAQTLPHVRVRKYFTLVLVDRITEIPDAVGLGRGDFISVADQDEDTRYRVVCRID